MNKNMLIAIGIVVLVISAGVARSFLNFVAQENDEKQFDAVISQYLSADLQEVVDEEFYRNGKVVIVDRDAKKVDYFTHRKLPEHLRAKSPSEVGTVVLLEWVTEEFGTYHDRETGEETGKANKISAELSVIDWKQKKLLGSKFIEGKDPLNTVYSEGDHAHYRPMFDVVEFVQDLPKR